MLFDKDNFYKVIEDCGFYTSTSGPYTMEQAIKKLEWCNSGAKMIDDRNNSVVAYLDDNEDIIYCNIDGE